MPRDWSDPRERSEDLRSSEFRVRSEAPDDLAVVHTVLARAFPSHAEATLVDTLRGLTEPQTSLVAEHRADGVIGHILFTPVEIRSPSGTTHAVGLGPIAVLPDFPAPGSWFRPRRSRAIRVPRHGRAGRRGPRPRVVLPAVRLSARLGVRSLLRASGAQPGVHGVPARTWRPSRSDRRSPVSRCLRCALGGHPPRHSASR